jgi:hypothetical protein
MRFIRHATYTGNVKAINIIMFEARLTTEWPIVNIHEVCFDRDFLELNFFRS